MPSSIGVMVIAIVFSVILATFGKRILSDKILDFLRDLPKEVNFKDVLMGAMLNFLLFAGGIHIKLRDLKENRRAISFFATFSVFLTAIFVAITLHFISNLFAYTIPFWECLLFGALIAPTDAIAVLSVLREQNVGKSLQATVSGESLFNDGTSIVLFVVVIQVVTGAKEDLTFLGITWFFIREFFGGIAIGLLLGYFARTLIKNTNDYKIAVMATLSVVMGGYILSSTIGVSAPLAMVSAGLFVGNMRYIKNEKNKDLKNYLTKFWEIIDDILNAILFLFIGLQVLVIKDLHQYWKLGVVAIIVVLFARFLSIWLPVKFIKFRNKIDNHTVRVLTWGGIRGGVSIALALSIPNEVVFKETFVAITYFVVIFSIIVQGLTIGSLADPKGNRLKLFSFKNTSIETTNHEEVDGREKPNKG